MAGSKLYSNGSWRWVAASETGTYHLQSKSPCEDAFAVSRLDGNVRMRTAKEFSKSCIGAVVADGAGSAKFGGVGAMTACLTLTNCIGNDVNKFCTDRMSIRGQRIPQRRRVETWIENTRRVMFEKAERQSNAAREFAAAIAGLVITPDGFAAWQIGDCAVVGRRSDRWEVICWPCEGEYASSTYFVTDRPSANLKYAAGGREFDAFALFSDGLNGVALVQEDQSAYQKFFSPIIRPVDKSSKSGQLEGLSEKLKRYLGSSAICQRTHDDKTLVLLSRR